MRLLRLGVLVLFVLCLALNIWTSVTYNTNHNTERPTLTCDAETIEISVADGPEALMQGLSAQDAQDGDLTGRILLASKSFFLEPGVFEAEYVVFDSHKNSQTLTRRVVYTDYTSPRFFLSEPLVFTRGENIRYLNYITAQDVLDGDLTDKIKVIASDVSNYTAGAYPVLLEVANSFGDTVQLELIIMVEEPNRESITIELSEQLTYIPFGGSFDPYEMIQSVTDSDGFRLSKTAVQVLGTVDTQTPGCYQLVFTCEQDGHEGIRYLTVVVEKEVA